MKFSLGWVVLVIGVLLWVPQGRTEETHMKSGSFGEYLSQTDSASAEDSEENPLLAPFAKPVEVVIQDVVDPIVEPFLEEKDIQSESGETKAKIKPKEGKVQFNF